MFQIIHHKNLCRKVWEKSVVLMDVESFNENTEFEQILGYINTAVESQKKGVTGDVK